MAKESEQLLSAWPAWPLPRSGRSIPLTTLGEHPCPYLPGRTARNRAFLCSRLPGEAYHELMDAGFRRSGTFIYQPVCAGCRQCTPLRVPVERFRPSKSQRRVWRRNQDLVVTVAPPTPTEEKHQLYARYVRQWHGKDEVPEAEEFVDFLYRSPVETIEVCYRAPSEGSGGAGSAGAGELVGVGICDVSARSLSSVYFYFAPEHAERRLGTFSSLWEIELARRSGIPFYYLGYWIRDCRAMSYKASFRPCEVLCTDGTWRPCEEGEAARDSVANSGQIVG